MALVLPLPFINPNCISSISICCRILERNNLIKIDDNTQHLRAKFVDAFGVVLKSGDLIAEAVESVHVSAVIKQLQVLLLQHVKPHLLQHTHTHAHTCNKQHWLSYYAYLSWPSLYCWMAPAWQVVLSSEWVTQRDGQIIVLPNAPHYKLWAQSQYLALDGWDVTSDTTKGSWQILNTSNCAKRNSPSII